MRRALHIFTVVYLPYYVVLYFYEDIGICTRVGMASDTRPNRPDKVREKIMLKPGFHLSDWVRLSQALGGKPLRKITRTELALHNSQYDCWTAYKGKVYDVTQYLAYHPGGMPKLMLGAGNDCTVMYNKYHPWVNAETMLAKCMIGILIPDDGEDTSKSVANDTAATAVSVLYAAAAIRTATSSHDEVLSAFDERAHNDDDDVNIVKLSLTRIDSGNHEVSPSSSSLLKNASSVLSLSLNADSGIDVLVSDDVFTSGRNLKVTAEDACSPTSDSNDAGGGDAFVIDTIKSSDKDS